MSSASSASALALLDLVDPTRWQRLQDHFASVLGVTIRTLGPARQLLVNPSWPFGLPVERAMAVLKIGEELEPLLPSEALPQATTTLTTPLGVTYAAVPIHVTDEWVLAYLVVGPMVVGRREEESQFAQRASELGVEAKAAWPLALSLKLYSFAGIRSVLSLLEEVSASITQLAYQAKQLAAILPQTSITNQAVIAYHRDRVVESLLDAAVLATKAEGGSVMLYDSSSAAYRIAIAQGLPEDVVRLARVGLGEGIAGVAAERGQILMVDDRLEDPLLKTRMQRPSLVSSLVAPLIHEAGTRPVGILNLRTSNASSRFSPEAVELLRKLTQLAQTALASLKLLVTPPTRLF